jgi:hypothetical protein
MAHTENNDPFESINRFVTAMVSDEPTAALDVDISQILEKSDEACDIYVECVQMSLLLPSILAAESEEELASSNDFSSGPCKEASPYRFPGLLSPALHNALGYFSDGMPLAYLIATVIFGVGLLIGSRIYVSGPEQFARESSPTKYEKATRDPQMLFVGRITGMVDCKWNDAETAPTQNARVSLGSKFTLASGLMEITYETGAKVILQGPVTYEVGVNGGFLAVGRMTGKLEKKVVRDQPRNGHTPLFTIVTPTATVTDLGTEFGVEVRSSGVTMTHVFRGAVELQPIAGGVQRGPAVRLTANESAQVETSGLQTPTVSRGKDAPTTFIRGEQFAKLTRESLQNGKMTPFERWQAYRRELCRDSSLLAYYDFQPNEAIANVLTNVAHNGNSSLDGRIQGATWTDGQLDGKRALRFNSPSDYVSIRLPQHVDNLTLTAWIYVDSLHGALSGLLMSDGWSVNGQIHFQLVHDGIIGFDVYNSASTRHTGFASQPVFADADRLHRWTHLAIVHDRDGGCVRFYADGRSLGQAELDKPVPICIGSARIGQWNCPSNAENVGNEKIREFRGRISELAIFGRVLTWKEIRHMFEAGCDPSLRIAP